MMDPRKASLVDRMESVRNRTLHLLEQVPDEFLRRRVHEFYSPIGWHFGHVGRTEDYWINCAALKQGPYDADLDFLYTDRADNPKDHRVRVLERAEVIFYLDATRARVFAALDEADLDAECPYRRDGYAWDFAIQHECQHQETICEMLSLIQAQIHADLPRSGSITEGKLGVPELHRWIEVAGGTFRMGTSEAMAYDNEKEPHEVSVGPFRIAEIPVTCATWAAFIQDGGYLRDELWTPEGADWRNREQAVAPEYWRVRDGEWVTLGPFGVRQMHPQEPVLGISHHEAEAFARWSQARLPTEEEWEFLASAGRYAWGDDEPDLSRARYGMHDWGPAPVGNHPNGATPTGVQDLAGNVWEWTSSRFLPYQGFQAFPYDGYSKDHMQGEHFVCRGGSWATAGPILRRTFRNWYVPSYRQGFLGLRLAC